MQQVRTVSVNPFDAPQCQLKGGKSFCQGQPDTNCGILGESETGSNNSLVLDREIARTLGVPLAIEAAVGQRNMSQDSKDDGLDTRMHPYSTWH